MKNRIVVWGIVHFALMPLCATCLADTNSKGIVIEVVDAGSSADKAGLKPGDHLLSYDGKPLLSTETFSALRDNTVGKKTVAITFLRDQVVHSAIVPLGPLGVDVRPEMSEATLRLFRAGRTADDSDKVDLALSQYKLAAESSKASGNNDSYIYLVADIAELYVSRHSWKQAKELYMSVLENVKGGKDAALQARMLYYLGLVYRSLGEADTAVSYLQRALSMDEREGFEVWKSDDLNGLGGVAYYRGDLTSAQSSFERSLAIRENLEPDGLDVAENLNNLGGVFMARGELKAAQDYFDRSRAIRLRREPESQEYADTLSNLGLLAMQRADLNIAQDLFERSLALYTKKDPNSLGAAYRLYELGTVAFNRRDFKSALQYYVKANAIGEKLMPDSLNTALNLETLGTVSYSLGDLKSAQEYYERGLTIQEKLAPASLDVASSLNNLGNVAELRKDYSSAVDYHVRALAIVQKLYIGSPDIARSLNSIGSIYEKLGRADKAKEYYVRAATALQQIPGSLYILSVGISGSAASSPGLNLAGFDAQEVADKMEAVTKPLFRQVYKRTLMDATATFKTLHETFDELAAEARPEDTFMLYYAGASRLGRADAKSTTELFLAPADAGETDDDLAAKGISARLLKTWSNRIQAQKQLLIVDSCAPDRTFNQFALQVTMDDDEHKELLARQMLVMGSVGQRHAFRNKHGMFAEAMLRGLSGEAVDNADGGKLTAAQLESFMRIRLLQISQQTQRVSSAEVGDDFPIQPVAPRAAKAAANTDRGPRLAGELQSVYRRNGKDFALLIATNEYTGGFPNLRNPLNDVEALDKLLRDQYGFETKVVRNPTRKEALEAIVEVLERKDFNDEDQVLIYIAGHGLYDDRNGGFVICKDSLENDKFGDTYITYDKLVRFFNHIQCKHTLLVLDACYAGTIFDRRGSGAPPNAAISENEVVKQVMGHSARLILTSGNKEPVPDGEGSHSPFSYHLLEALSQSQKRGLIRMSDLMVEVQKAKPQPVYGVLAGNDPGSDFLFIPVRR